MFIVIINFPPIKAGKDEEFREWFAWSNKEFAKSAGFISRRLLKPVKGGNYAALAFVNIPSLFRNSLTP